MRWPHVLLGMGFVIAGATKALGSGDPMPRPVYVFADPQNGAERAAMASGRLGVVKGRTTDALLFLDWRRLGGLAVGQPAADALATPCCGSPASSQNAWLTARKSVPGVEPLYWLASERKGPNYVSIPTCFDDAFVTAAATLRDRSRRYGVASPAVRAWVYAQDAVFTACSKPVAALPVLAPDAPGWLRADRAYQEAALALYNGNNDEAARRFAAIANGPASPWRSSGLYLAARALEHAAIDAPSAARFATAYAALDRLASAPAGTFGQGELPRMRQVLAFHEHPDQLLARLDRDLRAKAPIPDIAPAVRDYMTLADRHPDKPDAADWIRTVQAKDRAIGLAHALKRWRASGRSTWLIAALILSDPEDAGAPALAAAGDRIGEADPAWLTARYHRLRLLMPRASPTMIRAEADAVLARGDLSRSDQNVFEAIRAQAASSLADFAKHALRRPYCDPNDDACTGVSPSGDELMGRLRLGDLAGLGPDARAVIDRLPLRERMALVDVAWLPREVRLDLALTNYVRAVQLRDDAAVDRMASRLVELLPQVSADWRRIVRTPPGPDKLFAETFVMMKIPSLRTDFADYARPTGSIRQFTGYWVDLLMPRPDRRLSLKPFVPASAYLPSAYWHGDDGADPALERVDLTCLGQCGGGPFTLHPPAFAQSLTPRALAERRSFLVTPLRLGGSGSLQQTSQETSLWSSAFNYAAGRPSDPRAPEALYRLIRVARWGGNHDHLGRRAFNLIHHRYPRSAWAKRSPFYYE